MSRSQDIEGIVASLREAIRSRGVTLTWVAVRTGVNYRSLHNYFNGTSDMPMRVYLAICGEIGIAVRLPGMAEPAGERAEALA